MTNQISLTQAKMHITALINASQHVPSFEEARIELEKLHAVDVVRGYTKPIK